MNLTKYQKRIVEKINSGDIYDAFSFIMLEHRECFKVYKINDSKSQKYSQTDYEYNKKNKPTSEFVFGTQYACIEYKNKKTIIRALTEFTSLLSLLDEYHLIIKIYRQDLIDWRLLLVEIDNDFNDCLTLHKLKGIYEEIFYSFFYGAKTDLTNYLNNIYIQPTVLLNDFIKDGFLTKIEKHNIKTSKHSLLAIGVAIITSFASINLPLIINDINNKKAEAIQIQTMKEYSDFVQRIENKIDGIHGNDELTFSEIKKILYQWDEKIKRIEANEVNEKKTISNL